MLYLSLSQDEFDAWSLKDAMGGAGTVDNTLIEILSTRTNEELKRIHECFKTLTEGKDLVEEIGKGKKSVGLHTFYKQHGCL